MAALLLALALQGMTAAEEAAQRVTSAADHQWIACRIRALDGLIPSARSDEEVVAAAFAACTVEEEAVHAALVAQFGQALGDQGLTVFKRYSRGAMMDRVREVRGR